MGNWRRSQCEAVKKKMPVPVNTKTGTGAFCLNGNLQLKRLVFNLFRTAKMNFS
jgi:hypothetical protein